MEKPHFSGNKKKKSIEIHEFLAQGRGKDDHSSVRASYAV
jgi:hypothetical protein